jgi:hypothetical protein
MWNTIKAVFTLVDWPDVWVRTFKTAWQAALGVFIAVIPTLSAVTHDTWKSVLLGALASLISAVATAVWNGVLAPMLTAWKDSLDK